MKPKYFSMYRLQTFTPYQAGSFRRVNRGQAGPADDFPPRPPPPSRAVKPYGCRAIVFLCEMPPKADAARLSPPCEAFAANAVSRLPTQRNTIRRDEGHGDAEIARAEARDGTLSPDYQQSTERQVTATFLISASAEENGEEHVRRSQTGGRMPPPADTSAAGSFRYDICFAAAHVSLKSRSLKGRSQVRVSPPPANRLQAVRSQRAAAIGPLQATPIFRQLSAV